MSVARRGLRNMPDYASYKVKAGILAGATYPPQTLTDARTGAKKEDPRAGMPVALIAASLNYGTAKIPPRPFMNETAARERKAWADGVVKLVRNGMTFEQALTAIGQVMAEDIQTTINDWPADNSDPWAAYKGFSKGLFFTGVMLRSISFAVAKKDE